MDAPTTDLPVRLLHLSDLHFSTRSQWDADPILRALARFIAADIAEHQLYPDLVVITGDLANAGRREEYQLARQWLDGLWPCLTSDPATPLARDRLLLVPGNHDVDWGLIEPGARDAHQAMLQARTQEAVTDRLKTQATRDLLLKRHAAYLKFYGDWLGQRQTRPWWQRRIAIRGQSVHVAGLDSAWLAGGDDDSRLLLSTYQINQTVLHPDGEGDWDWRLALLHHPWASLAEFDRNDTQRTLHRHRDLILRGHLHQPDLFRIVPADPRYACIEAAAGCCYSGKPYPNAFQWIELSTRPRRVEFHFRCWNRDDWQVDRNQHGCPQGMHRILCPVPADAVQLPATPESPGRPAGPTAHLPMDDQAIGSNPGPRVSVAVAVPSPAPAPAPSRRPATLPEDAEREIRAALDASPTLCLALAKQLATAPLSAPLAARLCDPSADFLAALDALDQALCALARLPRLAPDAAARQLREDALTILGWIAVGTVADGCEREDAALVAEKWRQGDVFKVPLGRGPCVEVLTARWRSGKAEFSVGTETVDASPYDLAPAVMQELGFDDPEDLTAERAVDAVINRVYQESLRRQANDRPTPARRQDAPSWLRGQVRKHKRRFRLVMDLHHPLADPEVLRAIKLLLPDLLLILVNDQADEDSSVFILPPADLTNAIRDCLAAIGKLP